MKQKRCLVLVMLTLVGSSLASHKEQSDLYVGTYSDNFVHRWGIQSIAQHSFDPRLEAFPTDSDAIASFDPASVKKGDIIFVRDVCRFMQELHPAIEQPYVMITAGDYKDRMEPEFIDFLDDDMIIAWFCVHPCNRKHPKYHWLPLGIFQDSEFDRKKTNINKLFTLWRKTPKDKLL